MIAAFIVDVSWFVIIYSMTGAAWFSSFFDDQVGIRVSSGIIRTLSITLQDTGFLIAFTLPWV